MRIGIIGAGISGLTAGSLLAKAGHEVMVFEKGSEYGGRLATRYAGHGKQIKLDHVLTHFSVESPEFSGFVSELIDKHIVKIWGENFALYDGLRLYEENPNKTGKLIFTAADGMNTIGKYLARWVDIRLNVKAGGLTYFGPERSKKRAWMINLTDYNTFEADAVVVALPAPRAYSVILTTQDETETLKIIRNIDDIDYDPAYSLLAGYGESKIPSWQGILCKDDVIEFVSNEANKSGGTKESAYVIRSTPFFAKKNQARSDEEIIEIILDRFSHITGNQFGTPVWTQLHLWRYSKAKKTVDQPWFEIADPESPLALVGDYFQGNSVDAAYRSGFLLANDWIRRFEGVKV